MNDVVEVLYQCIGERSVVDVQREAHEATPLGLPNGLLERVEQRGIGCGIVEWLAGCHFGSALKSRTYAQTASIGASITALR